MKKNNIYRFAIRGHETRHNEIISIFKSMNYDITVHAKEHFTNKDVSFNQSCKYPNLCYYPVGNTIHFCDESSFAYHNDNFIVFSLEEWLEKYPFKKDDIIIVGNKSTKYIIENMHWNTILSDMEYVIRNFDNPQYRFLAYSNEISYIK